MSEPIPTPEDPNPPEWPTDPTLPDEDGTPPSVEEPEPTPEPEAQPGWAAYADEAAAEAITQATEIAGRLVPRNMDRAPELADGEGLPAGTGWNEYDPATDDLVQMWRWDGTVWARLDMSPELIPVIDIGSGTVGDLHGDRIVAHTISADSINGGAFTGETFTGGVFTGGLFKTSDGLAGQVEFADNAYSPSWASGLNYPGIRVEPTDASTTNIPPGIGSYGDGVIIDGGSDTSGRSSYAIMNPRASLLRTFRADGSTGGVVQTSPDGSLLRTYREDGSTGGVVQTSPGESRVQTYGAGGGYGWVQATGTSAEVAAVNSSSNYVARVSVAPHNVYITSRGGGQSAGGVIEAGTSGASVKRLNASNMAVCGMETENNQTRIYGSDGTYMRGQVAAGRDGIIAKSGHGPGFNVLDDGFTITGSATAGSFTGSILRLEDAPTTSAGASAVIATNPTGVLFRSTSSRRYKRNIVDWSPDAERVLALQPRQWQHSDPSQPGNIDETWHAGFVAEEVDELGLDRLVKYEGDGKGGWRPDGLNYDRFAAAHQVVLKKHEREIAALKRENAALVARLEAIEAKLG